jgi:hypothetical protein
MTHKRPCITIRIYNNHSKSFAYTALILFIHCPARKYFVNIDITRESGFGTLLSDRTKVSDNVQGKGENIFFLQ